MPDYLNQRRIDMLNRELANVRRRMTQTTVQMSSFQAVCNARKYHVGSARLTAILLLGGSVDKTVTWSAPFDDLNYAVEFALLDLQGSASVAEVSRTTADITIRVTAGLAQVALGAVFLVFGRSL